MLNAHYVALRVISARRAFRLLFKRDAYDSPLAEVVNVEDGRYVSYDFDDWRELSELRRQFEPAEHDWVRTVRFHIVVSSTYGFVGSITRSMAPMWSEM